MITRTRHVLMLHLHCLPCSVLHGNILRIVCKFIGCFWVNAVCLLRRCKPSSQNVSFACNIVSKLCRDPCSKNVPTGYGVHTARCTFTIFLITLLPQ